MCLASCYWRIVFLCIRRQGMESYDLQPYKLNHSEHFFSRSTQFKVIIENAGCKCSDVSPTIKYSFLLFLNRNRNKSEEVSNCTMGLFQWPMKEVKRHQNSPIVQFDTIPTYSLTHNFVMASCTLSKFTLVLKKMPLTLHQFGSLKRQFQFVKSHREVLE